MLNNQWMLPSNEGLTRNVLSPRYIDLWKGCASLFHSISADSLGHHFTEESVPKCLDNHQRISCLRCQPKALKSCSHPEAIQHHSSYWSAFHGAQNHQNPHQRIQSHCYHFLIFSRCHWLNLTTLTVDADRPNIVVPDWIWRWPCSL